MTPRKKSVPITADSPLPVSLTLDFSESLKSLLIEDGSEKALYLSQVLLSKYNEPGAGHAESRRSAAITKWLRTEERNALTNKRILSSSDSRGICVLPGISAKRFFDKVASVVADVLPWTPSLDIAVGGFSGGASTSKGRRRSHPATKFLDKADITRPALPLFYDLSRGTRWADHIGAPGLEPRFVEGNVMFTVPKDSEIDRCACKEPDLNMFMQKMFGNQIRSLLKRKGINLNDQSINAELARKGSVDGSLMTLDLSSASDSVTTAFVQRVLPREWFHYMSLVRCAVTTIDGIQHHNEMFSSMGNGFTFELESLLFYSIARTVAYFGGFKGSISVYGDDIIAPSSMSTDLVSALEFCGFKTNPNKSFWDGPFRESCGAHWHGGYDIKPFYIRGPISTVSSLILVLNQLTHWASRDIGVVDPHYEDLLRRFRDKYVPQSLWGGSDLTSRVSLVTGHAPRSELYYPTEEKPVVHTGGLLLWLFQTLNRVREGCLYVSDSSLPSFARLRRRKRCETLHYTSWESGVPVRRKCVTDIGDFLHDVPVFLQRDEYHPEGR